MNKIFRVLAISKNTNSFGLHQVVLVARDGEAWKVCHYQGIRSWAEGMDIKVQLENGNLQWALLGVEIPEKTTDAPKKVLEAIFKYGISLTSLVISVIISA